MDSTAYQKKLLNRFINFETICIISVDIYYLFYFNSASNLRLNNNVDYNLPMQSKFEFSLYVFLSLYFGCSQNYKKKTCTPAQKLALLI